MINISIADDVLSISGSFDFGYIGIYKDDQICILDNLDEIKEWDIVSKGLDVAVCTDEEIVQFIMKYFNDFEKRIKDNIKLVNDNFLLNMFVDMEACGCEFWKIKELVIEEKMPSTIEGNIYEPYWDTLSELAKEYDDVPNDGTVKKTDVEAVVRKNYPMFDLDNFIKNIIPESVTLTDGYISFQCSDNFNYKILCSAYDELDESLRFTDWHNF